MTANSNGNTHNGQAPEAGAPPDVPMAQLLAIHHSIGAQAPVAMDQRGGAIKTLADLRQDVAILASRLPAATPDSHVAMVFGDDRYHFTAALLAAWSAGHAVALPPNVRRDTVKAVVDRPEVVAILHDLTAGLGLRVPDMLSTGAATDDTPGPLAFQAHTHAATLFTSGSTGQTQPWAKTFGQLLGEVATLGTTFPTEPGAVTVATVPSAHLYGLLFSVLLPLSTGGVFVRTAPFAPEAIAATVRDTAASVLVSVPAHLRVCTTIADGAFDGLTRVFSSTAPLPAPVASALTRAHQVPLIEIFGSTETGGIGSRQQAQGPHWWPLPGVSVSLGRPEARASDGHESADSPARLMVESPWLHPTSQRPFASGDLAVLVTPVTPVTPDGVPAAFEHRGRADDVVKVGGRRVSLLAMERTLLGAAGVEDAVVVAIPDTTGRGNRIVAAVCGDGVDASQARAELLASFDASTVPRAIKVLDTLPRESNGKLVRTSLLRAFGLTSTGEPVVHTLRWSEPRAVQPAADTDTTAQAPTRWRFASELPPTYIMFEGHFTGYPVLAGAVQLSELVLPCVQKVLPNAGRLSEMKGLKFTKRLAPGDAFEVELSWQPESPERVDFQIRKGELTCSAGKLRFAS